VSVTVVLGFLFLAGVAKRVWAQQAVEKKFDQLDKNKDGKITPDELPAAELFKRLDLDGNGEITRSEAARALARGKLNDLMKSSGDSASDNPMVKQIEAIAKSADTDGDGKITREEAADAPWFERADHNGDGVVDATEVETIKRTVAKMPSNGKPGSLLQAAPSVTADDIKKVTSGPEVLNPGEAGIGRMIADVKFNDIEGKNHQLSDLASGHGAILIMTSSSCPVSKRYLPEIAKLQQEFAKAQLPVVLINPFPSEKESAIRSQLAAQPLSAIYVHDQTKSFATTLAAKTTTEVFVIDRKRTLVYRGALDDQYGINYNLDAPRHRYLLEAIDALGRNESPAISATAAPGCELELDSSTRDSKTDVTYYSDVARILQQNCVSCHRDNGIAPFSLADLDSVQDHASVIKRVVTEGTMPPWFAANKQDSKSNPWANDCSLSSRDKSDLLAWIESKDRPLGEQKDAPEPKQYPSEWSIGKPDMVLTLSKPFDIKATGYMPYQFDVVETELTEDKWVTAYEILPSERDVVHHVIVKVHEKGSAARDAGEGAGGYWAVYVPGNGSQKYNQGFARLLPAGSKVSFQIHYTPSGTAKKERLRMGLVFAKDKPQYEVRTVGVAHMGISIPPNAAAHVETKTQRVPFDLPIMGFMPHMHIRGAAFKYEAIDASGKSEVLLDIPRYDFNWQLNYSYKTPKLVPRGSTIKVTAVYNNSESNAANPDPGKRVKWGPQTIDEMMIGYVEYFVPLTDHKVAAK
jgi:Ca2+-binding EF-hand superfamily protein/thiol-disulfide isomerase/thioredoxin